MKFLRKKRIDKLLEPVERAKDGKLSTVEKNRMSGEIVEKIEEQPELLEDVLRQLYERGMEFPYDLQAEISTKVIKGASESEKVPDGSVVEATKAIVGNLSDDEVARLARIVDLGIKDKNEIVEAGISDEEKKRKEKVNLAINNLQRLHDTIEDIPRDAEVVDKIKQSIENLPERKDEEEYKINQLINSIIAKKIMQNYVRYGNTQLHTFLAIQSPEEMFANNIPQLAKCEYRQIPTTVREQYDREYKEEVFRRNLITVMANRVAEEFERDGFKKIRIPQSRAMRNISEEEEEYFIREIEQNVEKANGTINPLTMIDIKEQIRGNVKAAEEVAEYVSRIGDLPKDTKQTFIEQGQEIMSDKKLLEISDYCNKVGLYQALASLGVDKAKRLVDTVMDNIEKRKYKIATREDIPKIVGAKFEKEQKTSETQADDKIR